MKPWNHSLTLLNPKINQARAPPMAGLRDLPASLNVDAIFDSFRGLRERPLLSPSAQKSAMQDSSWADVRSAPLSVTRPHPLACGQSEWLQF